MFKNALRKLGFKSAREREIDKMLKAAKKRMAAMTEAEREQMLYEQRKSFVRGELGFGSDEDERQYRTAVHNKQTALETGDIAAAEAADIEIRRLDQEALERIQRAGL